MARKLATLQQTSSVLNALYKAGYTETRELLEHDSSPEPRANNNQHTVDDEEGRRTDGAGVGGFALSSALRGAVLSELHHTQSSVDACIVSGDQLAELDCCEHVTTFSRRLDWLLSGRAPDEGPDCAGEGRDGGGGFVTGRVTELLGEPGCGKTQLCLQACVDACLPACVGALDASAIYVDTEGGVVAERLRQIAEAAVTHCQRLVSATQQDQLQLSQLLARISLVQLPVAAVDCHQHLLQLLPLYINQQLEESGHETQHNQWRRRPPPRLLVIDSISAPMRQGDASDACHMRRSQRLQWLIGELARLARRHRLAVVVTNHVTSDVIGGRLVPALGASWQHCCAVRVALTQSLFDRRGGWTCAGAGLVREAHLLKHTDCGHRSVRFQILGVGVRDVCLKQETSTADDATSNPPTKKNKY